VGRDDVRRVVACFGGTALTTIPPNPLTVLLVDDDSSFRKSLKELIEIEGYAARDFSTAEEAIEFLKREGPSAAQYAFIDYYLRPTVPNAQQARALNGIDATRELLKVSPNLRVVLFSAKTHLPGEERALEAGACRVAIKRDEEDLRTFIADLIRELEELQELARQAQLDRDQRERIAATVESLAVGMLLIDREAVPWACNRQWREIEGKTDPLAHPLHTLADSVRKDHSRRELFEQAIQGTETKNGLALCAVMDGRLRYLHTWARPVTDSAGKVFACSLTVLDATSTGEIRHLTLEKRLGLVLDAIRTCGYERARVYAVRDKTLEGIAQRGDRINIADFKGYQIHWPDDPCAHLFDMRKSLIVEYSESDPQRYQLQIKSDVACIPVFGPRKHKGVGPTASGAAERDEIIGVLAVDQFALGPLGEEDLTRLLPYALEAQQALREDSSGDETGESFEALLTKVKADIAGSSSPEEAMQVICTAVLTLTECQAAHIRVKVSDEAVLVASAGGPFAQYLTKRLQCPPSPRSVGGPPHPSLSVRVLQSGNPIILNKDEKLALLRDATVDQESIHPLYAVASREYNCFAAYPLTLTNVVGVLSAQAKEVDHFKKPKRRAALVALAQAAAMTWLDASRARDRKAAETQRDMAFTTVHNLRQPVTAMRLALDSAVRRYKSGRLTPEDAHEIVVRAIGHLGRAEDIITAVHRFLKPPDLTKSNTNLKEVVDAAMKVLIDHPWIDLKQDIPPEIVIRADKESLTEVITELIQNAAQIMEARGMMGGSRITVACQLEGTQPRATPGMTGDWVRLRVEDNGPGVAGKVERTLFDQGVTTRADGTGLGLAFVKHVVEGHGGRVYCEPVPSGGASFVILLPASEQSEP
jgi:signal transduction histidine kinase/FixJ family two-component response regulator